MISFCVTCRNRLWQLRQTLGFNLDQLGGGHEIVLVDFGSSDGLAEWVWSNFRGAIESSRLRFFEVTNPVHWNCARAKNLAHRLARGDYVFNLDADNWITPLDVAMIARAAEMGLPSHQGNSFKDGSFGRIGLPRSLFMEMGGYDENLLPMGSQDLNLLERMQAMNLALAKLPAAKRPAVQNTFEHKVSEAGGERPANPHAAAIVYAEMNRLNLAISRARTRLEGPRYQGGFASFRGRLDGVAVTIDGFDVIRPA